MAQETFYFPHDYNPFDDPGVKMLAKKHGAVGYGIFWRIVELLHQNADHSLVFKQPIYFQIADDLLVTPEFVEQIIEECIGTYCLFESNGEIFWSNRVFKNVEKRKQTIEQRSVAGKASADARKKLKDIIETHPELLTDFNDR